MSDAKRIPSLDGLRGIAAIGVMLFHFNGFFLPQARLNDILPYLNRAYLAVDLFFLLSGFVMAHVYGRALALNWRAHWLKFAVARFARLYPLFVATTLVMIVAVALSHIPIGVSFSRRSLAFQPFLLQQWASTLSWDYPSWSISTETEAYVYFVLFAGLLLTGRHPGFIAAGGFLVLVSLSVFNGGRLLYFVGVPALLRTLSGFTLGVLLYRLHSSDADLPLKWMALATIVLAGLAMATHFDFLIVGAFGCLIYYCVNTKGAMYSLLNSRPIVALGNWSYSIYLWHAPTHYIVMALFAAIGFPVSTLGLSSARVLLFATALVVIGISGVSYQYFETPIRRSILNLGQRIGRSGKADLRGPFTHS